MAKGRKTVAPAATRSAAGSSLIGSAATPAHIMTLLRYVVTKCVEESGCVDTPTTAAAQKVDFDTHPPVPAAEYAQTVVRVNVGYELMFRLAHSALRALSRTDLRVLVVGAGGGAEIETFLPTNPGWSLTGVDPSRDMLALAQARAESLRVAHRVTLLPGTVEALPADALFDAATCLFVLHFLTDDDKCALLHGIARHLHPGAPVLVASGARFPTEESMRTDAIAIWQQYAELAGMPAEQMAAMIDRLMAQQVTATSEHDYVRLFHTAGFNHVVPLLSVFDGGLMTWLIR